jgi:hypothetical protein
MGQAIQAALVKCKSPLKITQKFGCEIAENKREFGMQVQPDLACCCFVDIMHLSSPMAECARHKQKCAVPRVNGRFSQIPKRRRMPSSKVTPHQACSRFRFNP